jgi:hypothetical protein
MLEVAAEQQQQPSEAAAALNAAPTASLRLQSVAAAAAAARTAVCSVVVQRILHQLHQHVAVDTACATIPKLDVDTMCVKTADDGWELLL